MHLEFDRKKTATFQNQEFHIGCNFRMMNLKASSVATGLFLLVCIVSACALATTRYEALQFTVHLLINLILTLVGLGASMRAWARERRRQAICFGLGVALIAGSLAADAADKHYHVGAQIAVRFDRPKYESCRTRGAIITAGKVLSVCDVNAAWNEFLYTEAVVFDASDEVARPARDYSARWRAAARSLDSRAPFQSYGFDAYPLGHHYYLLTFNYDARPVL